MNHTCSHCVVHCMDFRIQKTVDNLLADLGIVKGSFDRVSVAGGAANFEQLETHLTLSKKLHNPSIFILTIHEDCGADAKLEDLDNARRLIKNSCPECEIRTFFVRLDGGWEEK